MSIMDTMERKQPRARRSFTPEFKAEIVQLCQQGNRSIGQVARDLDLHNATRLGAAAPDDRGAGRGMLRGLRSR
jgi:transposase